MTAVPSDSPSQASRRIPVSPFKVVTLVWLLVLATRHLPLVTFPALRPDVVVFLLGSYAAFGVGYFLVRYARRVRRASAPEVSVRSPAPSRQPGRLRKAIIFFALAGALGAALRGVDVFLLRGLDFSGGVSAARLENIAAVEMGGAGARPLSAIGRLLTCCATVALLAAFLRYEQLTPRLRLLAGASWMLTLLLSVLEGGRNTIVINLVLVLVAGLVRQRGGRKFSPFKPIVKLLLKAGALVVLAYVMFVFADRFQALGYTDLTVIAGVEKTFSVEVAPWVGQLEPGVMKNVVLSGVMLVVYVGHGVDQIGALLDWLTTNSAGYGRYNLDLIALTIGRLGLPIGQFPFADLPKPGLYLTAIGELVLDVGRTGTLILLFLTGILMGRLWRILPVRNTVASEMLLCFGLGWLVASPLYSILSGFLGVVLAMLAFQVSLLILRALRFLR
jgi:hypothetical protein